MQWRMLARRGRAASWTVVGDAAQASWSDLAEAGRAREEAFSGQERRAFHMDTNYRNAREIFDYARDFILPLVPDADIPDAVRETGSRPGRPRRRGVAGVGRGRCRRPAARRGRGLDRGHRRASLGRAARPGWTGPGDGRVQVIDPLSTKGLEWDATVVVDPQGIVEESPGGVRVLYVVLTRAAHRMHVLRPA